ncbi:MAG: hypothetical protein ACK5MV_04010 [Aminipila sp.]
MFSKIKNKEYTLKQTQYEDWYEYFSNKSCYELQVTLNIYELIKLDYLRKKNLYNKVPYFFTVCLAIVALVDNNGSENKLNLLVLLLFFSFLSIIDIFVQFYRNNKINQCELIEKVCSQLLSDKNNQLNNASSKDFHITITKVDKAHTSNK